ncbi:sister chromatid cohesion protein Dcc1 [Mycotypha africana]|uniref:sister chromatid cohesion protein Dcc1 n=1 Tax=Mycotypha africana TaxID=64632 RepID=UPI002301AC0A|nr:sister chromatid cohesion protein Dcc1 [Mycotypha africana]KAI8982349.1 sister chromatid cohesion protein Dcc1 [Mycotypha africana]
MESTATSNLIYSSDFEKGEYQLLELATPELQEVFKPGGQSVFIKGLPDEEAVLCTNARTYQVRQVHTSNSMLLISKNEETIDDVDQYLVHDDISNYVELAPTIPRLNRIDELLMQAPYAGTKKDSNYDHTQKLYTYNDILSVVQASESELIDGLEQKSVFGYGGYMRMFDRDYLLGLLDAFFTNASFHSKDLQHITLGEVKQCITEERQGLRMQGLIEDEDLSDPILLACINHFVTDKIGTKDNHDDTVVRFDEAKVCRFLGEWLLIDAQNKSYENWELSYFMKMWKTLSLNLFEPKLEYIEGLYKLTEITKVQKVEQHISYFPVSALPMDPARRFAVLFGAKEFWSAEEITPFLSDLAPKSKERENLLLKFARMRKENDKVLYASRINKKKK